MDELILERWTGPVGPDDPHANFKREVAASALLDPGPTLENLAAFVGLPVGAVARHALVRWVSAGSDALLEVGPTWVRRLAEPLLTRLDEDLSSFCFAWAGATGPVAGQPHYYRVDGPGFLVEFDNRQNGANHIHSVWRDPGGDFGPRLLPEVPADLS